MDLNQIFAELNFGIFLSLVIKLFAIVSSLLYLFFSIVIKKQVQIMKRTVEIQDRGLLLLTGYIQLILAIILVFYSLFIL